MRLCRIPMIRLHPWCGVLRTMLVLVLAGGLGSCSRAVCPTNQAASAAPGAKPGAPVKSAGTLDKNGRFKKKNAYHPSARQAGK